MYSVWYQLDSDINAIFADVVHEGTSLMHVMLVHLWYEIYVEVSIQQPVKCVMSLPAWNGTEESCWQGETEDQWR